MRNFLVYYCMVCMPSKSLINLILLRYQLEFPHFGIQLCQMANCNFHSTDVCNMEKEEGNCLAYFQRYFYNKKTQSCEGFIYGGCGGNANNFDSLDACNRKCIQRGQLHTNTGGIQMYKQLARHKKSFHI